MAHELLLPKTLIAKLTAADAEELRDALRRSGTGFRLAHAGLAATDDAPAVSSSEVHATTAFRCTAPGVWADVYLFDSGDAMTDAHATLQRPMSGEKTTVSQNGAFLVRIWGAADRVTEVASAIAGDE